LNEEGYQKVAKRRSKAHMMAFARRILDAEDRKCNSEGDLSGMMSYFDGEISVQTFEQLRRELLSASWAQPREKVEATQYMETHKVAEDPVETTLATTTLATTLATTTLATTLATTTLATTLATTTLATTLATTTLATTLATTTLATTLATTTEAAVEEVEEALQRSEEAKLAEHGSFIRESAETQTRSSWNPIHWLSNKFRGDASANNMNASLVNGEWHKGR
jgi:hypothetical protein